MNGMSRRRKRSVNIWLKGLNKLQKTEVRRDAGQNHILLIANKSFENVAKFKIF
jgi:hypothetical protein